MTDSCAKCISHHSRTKHQKTWKSLKQIKKEEASHFKKYNSKGILNQWNQDSKSFHQWNSASRSLPYELVFCYMASFFFPYCFHSVSARLRALLSASTQTVLNSHALSWESPNRIMCNSASFYSETLLTKATFLPIFLLLLRTSSETVMQFTLNAQACWSWGCLWSQPPRDRVFSSRNSAHSREWNQLRHFINNILVLLYNYISSLSFCKATVTTTLNGEKFKSSKEKMIRMSVGWNFFVIVITD